MYSVVFNQYGLITPYARSILIGLLLSAVGDACLVGCDLGFFLPGVVSFGLAHLMYITAFGFETPKLSSLIPILACVLFLNLCVMSSLHGLLRIVGPVYSLVIGAMLWSAIDHSSLTSSPFNYYARLVGASLFYVSDNILALDSFVVPCSALRTLIMPTYYAGQLGIALSTLPSS